MSLLACWNAPVRDVFDFPIREIKVQRSASLAGTYTNIATVPAFDPYGNWVTSYVDESVLAIDNFYYRVEFFEENDLANLVSAGTSAASIGEPPYQITPNEVIENMQGIPLNWINSKLIQHHIGWVIRIVESIIKQKLSPTQAVLEPLPPDTWSRIIGRGLLKPIQLQRFPLQRGSIELLYRTRTSRVSPQPIGDLDIEIISEDPSTGFSRGMITVVPRHAAISTIVAGLSTPELFRARTVQVYANYTHGWSTWPADIESAIMQGVVKDVIELAANTENPGLSERSVDNYAESYTASATTTPYSAIRLYYEEQFAKRLTPHRKLLMG